MLLSNWRTAAVDGVCASQWFMEEELLQAAGHRTGVSLSNTWCSALKLCPSAGLRVLGGEEQSVEWHVPL